MRFTVPTSLLGAFAVSFFISCNASSTATQPPLFTNATGSPISVPDGPSNVLIADMNSDRKPDLVVACGRSHSVLVLPGKGDGQFGEPLSKTIIPAPPGEIALGDLNGDGKSDVAVAWRLAIGDLNGDNRIDVVTNNAESNNLSVLLGT